MNIDLITTTNDLEGYTVEKHFGIVRGITVRSRSIFGNFLGGLSSLAGGRNRIYTELCERTRKEAFEEMVIQANNLGANAIIGIQYDANEVMQGITEVLCYGTAVKVTKK